MHDLIIRGGRVVDGSGAAPFEADVAVDGGKIAAVGKIDGPAKQEIDARGMIVTPGFVDIHTHYDGQVTWGESLRPSTHHGVTTVVMGNCGVGFAPCRPEQRSTLVTVMEGVEDIPEVVMTAGVPWKWETFPEYLDFVGSRHYDADVAAYVPHGAIRVYVMGERAATGEPPTPEDLDKMTALVAEAVRAGAMGVGTSRTLMHQGSDGKPAPHVRSDRPEMLALAKGLKEAGAGMFQLVPRITDALLAHYTELAAGADTVDFLDREMDVLREVAEASGRPLTFSLVDIPSAPRLWSETLDRVRRLNEQGLNVTGQIYPRPVGLWIGLTLTIHPFKFHPTYLKIAHLPLAERVAELRKPEVKARLLSESMDREAAGRKGPMYMEYAINGYRLGDPPVYTLERDRSLIAEAEDRGISPYEVALEWLLEKDGENVYMAPGSNFSTPMLESVAEMLGDDHTLLGLGDGGAHYGTVCDASYATTLLSYWARDRKGDDRIPLPVVVNYLSRRNALAMGMQDRGLIAPGLRADINVIDFDGLTIHPPEVVHDLPAGGRRLTQRAKGYVATLVAGEVTQRNDEPTGARPGRLVRNPAA
jgi:N-acyl-D-aspartate/D-glutamate deacylase